MQPKFTQRNVAFFCTKIIALALIFSASTQFSFAQQNPENDNTPSVSIKKQKTEQKSKALLQGKNAKGIIQADNDAGLPNRVVSRLRDNPQAVCTTWTGSVGPADLPITMRSNRDGINKTCAVPSTCTNLPIAGALHHKILTWTNPFAGPQCVTVTYSIPTANPNFSFVTVFNGPVNITSLCTNWLSDAGSSATVGGPITFSFTAPSSATINFLVGNVAPGQTADYSIVIDAPTCTSAPPPPPPCSWSNNVAYPITAYDNYANVNLGGNIYSFGGGSNNAPVTNSYRFNGTTWTPIAALPLAKQGASAASDGTNIYILGGVTGGVPTSTVYRYNVASNTYTTMASFSTATWNHNSVYLNGKIYKFCGTGAANSVNALEIYDIASNTWTTGANYPLSASFVSAVAIGNFIYTGGGYQGAIATATDKTYRYDATANTWDDAAIADLPGNRWGAAFALYGPIPGYGDFVLAGGATLNSTTISNTVVTWNPIGNSWTSLPNLVTAAYRIGGVSLGPNMHVIGGSPFIGTTQNQRLACTFPACTGTPAPGATIGPSMVCGGSLFTLSLANVPSVTGFTFQWQSSSDNVTYTDIPGATAGTYTTSITTTTWYRAKVTCSGNTGTSTPLKVENGQGVFTSHPANATIQCSGNTAFSVTATGLSLTYSWEYRVNASSPWLTVTNGGIYSGATTSTLTLLNVPATNSGYQYRAVIVGPCTAVDFSNPATLTVNPLVATVSPTSATICTGSIVKLTLTNPTSTPIYGTPSALPLIVPDGSNAPALTTINVSNIPVGAVVTDISVRFTIEMTYVGDLDINLVAPNSNILNLVGSLNNGAGTNSSADFTNTVISSTSVTPISGAPSPRTGTFAADARAGAGPTGFIQNTTTWTGLTSLLNGDWKLALGDDGPGDVAKVTSWSIVITFVAPPALGIWTASPAAPNTMFSDAAATIPYVAGTPANSIWVKPTVNTNYSVVYSTTTPCISAPTVIPVSVSNPVSAVVNPVNTSACVGSSATFTASAGGGPLTYQWQLSINSGVTWTDIPGATSSSYTTPAAVPLMNNNRYRVVITAGPCGPATSAAAILTVNPLPVVTISTPNASLVPGQTTTITATSVPGAATASSWSWTLNGSPVAPPVTGNTITVGIDGVGAYQARVTDINGCVNTSNILNISSTASDKLWIYPNPTTGLFQVRVFYDGTVSDRRILSVIDMLGHVVIQREFDLVLGTPAYLRMDIDATRLPAGTYAVQVKHRVTGKIVSGLLVKFNN